MVIDENKRQDLVEKLKIENDFAGKKRDREAKKIYKEIQKKRKAQGKKPLDKLNPIQITPNKILWAFRILDILLFIVGGVILRLSLPMQITQPEQYQALREIGLPIMYTSFALAAVVFIVVPFIRKWREEENDAKPRTKELMKPTLCTECKNGLMFVKRLSVTGPVTYDVNFSGSSGSIGRSSYYDTNYLIKECDNCGHESSRQISNIEYNEFTYILKKPESIFAAIIEKPVKQKVAKQTKTEKEELRKKEIEDLKNSYLNDEN